MAKLTFLLAALSALGSASGAVVYGGSGSAAADTSVWPTTAATTVDAAATATAASASAAATSSLTPDEFSRLLKGAPSQAERINLLAANGGNASFVFDFNNPPAGANQTGPGGSVIPAFGATFPAVEGVGIGLALFTLDACGLVAPHLHPRSAEQIFVTEGTVFTQFIGETGDPLITNNLGPLQSTIFPAGSIHLELNPTCAPARFVAAFNNDDPGLTAIAPSFLGFNSEALTANIPAIAGQDIASLEASLPAGAVILVKDCLNRCGIKANKKRDLSQILGF